jgi:hypothetical protein
LPGSNLHHTAFFGESSASRCNNPSKERLPPFLIQSSSQFRFFCRVLVWIVAGIHPGLTPRSYSWAAGSKNSSFPNKNCTPAVIFRTRSPGVRWNNCEDINWFLTQFSLSISHMILLAPIHISAAIPNQFGGPIACLYIDGLDRIRREGHLVRFEI